VFYVDKIEGGHEPPGSFSGPFDSPVSSVEASALKERSAIAAAYGWAAAGYLTYGYAGRKLVGGW
jgi:hypothetical protein